MSLYNRYQSPFTWRYGDQELRQIWSEEHKRRLWRQLWVWLAEVEQGFGLVSQDQVEQLQAAVDAVDVERSLAVETRIQHDLMAEVKVYAAQCPDAGGIIHLGATSTDIKDNATVLQVKESLDVIVQELRRVLVLQAARIDQYADLPIIAFTHLQPAEPSTLGYRLAVYGQDMLTIWHQLQALVRGLRGKGFRGAVGTSASFVDLLGRDNLAAFEEELEKKLGIGFFPVVNQTYPRQQDLQVLNALAGLGAVLSKFAFDLRFLQSPPIAEWSEPFGDEQVGSSAMPFKRNPIQSEKINSLARMLAQLPRVAWDNAAHSLLERTLDDSANRRTILPEGFLITSELLGVVRVLLEDMNFYPRSMDDNLEKYGAFAATERVLMALGKAGADRQQMHERIRRHALQAWKAVQAGEENPLADFLASDEVLTGYLPSDDLISLLDVKHYLGNAPGRSREMAAAIQSAVKESK